MKHSIQSLFVVLLTLGLLACSNSDGGKKRKNPGATPEAASIPVTDADEKFEELEKYSLGTARLQIVERNADVLSLSFDKLEDGSVVYSLNGEVREQESKLGALANSRIANVADVRNIMFPSNTMTPSVFYVIAKETADAIRGDIYIFVYTDNQQPMAVAGPILVRTSQGLDIFNEVVRAYEGAGKNYMEFLLDLLEAFDANPSSDYRTLSEGLIASLDQTAEVVPGGTREDGCTKDCDTVVDAPQDTRRQDAGRVVREADIGVPEYRVRPVPRPTPRPRHVVAIVEDRSTPVVTPRPEPHGVSDAYLLELANSNKLFDHHPTHLCLDPRVTAYSAWGGDNVDMHPHRDDDGSQNTGNAWCTPESRNRVLEKARRGTLNRREDPARPCASEAQLQQLGFSGGFKFCRIKRVNVTATAAQPTPAETSSTTNSVILRCGRNYGATMSVYGEGVNVANASLCFNRPANSIGATNMIRLPGQNIPGVQLISVGYNFDFTKAPIASQFVTLGRVGEQTSAGIDVIFHQPQVFDLNSHRAQLNQLIRVVNASGEEISRINMGCTIERHSHYCGEGGNH